MFKPDASEFTGFKSLTFEPDQAVKYFRIKSSTRSWNLWCFQGKSYLGELPGLCV